MHMNKCYVVSHYSATAQFRPKPCGKHKTHIGLRKGLSPHTHSPHASTGYNRCSGNALPGCGEKPRFPPPLGWFRRDEPLETRRVSTSTEKGCGVRVHASCAFRGSEPRPETDSFSPCVEDSPLCHALLTF